MGQQDYRRGRDEGCLIGAMATVGICFVVGFVFFARDSFNTARIARERATERRSEERMRSKPPATGSYRAAYSWNTRSRKQREDIVLGELSGLLLESGERRGVREKAERFCSGIVDCIDREGAARTYPEFREQVKRCYEYLGGE